MGQNRQLATIIANLPEYEECRKEFFEQFYMFQKLGAVNYAALGVNTGLAGPSHEIVGIFLAGLALGRAQELSEQGEGQYWNALEAWTLVEDQLAAIRPDLPRLPAPSDIKVPSPKRARP